MKADDGRVVSNFITSALRGELLTIYGDGSQTRSFCYVDDLVRLIIACMDSDKRHESPINAGNPEEYTMMELATLVMELVDRDCSVVHHALPVDDPKKRRPDISNAKKVLNWEPTVCVREGLFRTKNYFQKTTNKSIQAQNFTAAKTELEVAHA